MKMINSQTAGTLSIILVTGICISFIVLISGLLWIAITKDGSTTQIVQTTFTAIAGVMVGSCTTILQHYLVSSQNSNTPNPPTQG